MLRTCAREYRQCHGTLQVPQGSAQNCARLHEEHTSYIPNKGRPYQSAHINNVADLGHLGAHDPSRAGQRPETCNRIMGSIPSPIPETAPQDIRKDGEEERNLPTKVRGAAGGWAGF